MLTSDLHTHMYICPYTHATPTPTSVDIKQEGVGWAWQYIPGIQKARGEGTRLATHRDSVLKGGWMEARQVFEQQKGQSFNDTFFC